MAKKKDDDKGYRVVATLKNGGSRVVEIVIPNYNAMATFTMKSTATAISSEVSMMSGVKKTEVLEVKAG